MFKNSSRFVGSKKLISGLNLPAYVWIDRGVRFRRDLRPYDFNSIPPASPRSISDKEIYKL